MDNKTNSQVARAFAGAFAESLAQSLSKAAGTPWQIAVQSSPDLGKSEGSSVHFRVALRGGLSGECFVEFNEPGVIELASSILRQPQSVFDEEHREALANVISSAMTGVAESMSGESGAVTFEVQQTEGVTFGGMFVVPLAVTGGEQTGMPVLVYFSSGLLEALSSPRVMGTSRAPEASVFDLANLELVMDVELNVSLRFGQRQLPLHEVLDLASGSVVELDRQVDDPVELLLDGKVIALGEAVIVDGNYGLRVTHIPQPIANQLIR
jgi:flagellar motor switch protein FliN/FliY